MSANQGNRTTHQIFETFFPVSNLKNFLLKRNCIPKAINVKSIKLIKGVSLSRMLLLEFKIVR